MLKHGYESFYKLIDKGFIEICGPQGFTNVIYQLAVAMSKKQSGYIYHSACLLLLGFFLLSCLILII